MKLNDFPRTCPDTLAAIGAALVDDPNLRLHQLDGILGTYPDAATAKVAFAGNDVNHQWRVTGHEILHI